MTNTINTTYKSTTTSNLIEDLKNKMFLAFDRGYLPNEVLLRTIDMIECELVSRGYSWEQIESLEASA